MPDKDKSKYYRLIDGITGSIWGDRPPEKKNMECLKCTYEFRGYIGDDCPKCKASCENVVDKKEKLE